MPEDASGYEPCGCGRRSRPRTSHLHEVAELVRSQSPRPPGSSSTGWPAGGASIRPSSSTWKRRKPPSSQVRMTPEPPPWRMLFVAISFTARTSASVVSRSNPLPGSAGHELAHRAERVGVEGEPIGRRRRVIEGSGEGRRDRLEPAVAAAFPKGLDVGHERMRRPASSTTWDRGP